MPTKKSLEQIYYEAMIMVTLFGIIGVIIAPRYRNALGVEDERIQAARWQGFKKGFLYHIPVFILLVVVIIVIAVNN